VRGRTREVEEYVAAARERIDDATWREVATRIRAGFGQGPPGYPAL
jgi:hypothetical protein